MKNFGSYLFGVVVMALLHRYYPSSAPSDWLLVLMMVLIIYSWRK